MFPELLHIEDLLGIIILSLNDIIKMGNSLKNAEEE
jgi:hypothetical protein